MRSGVGDAGDVFRLARVLSIIACKNFLQVKNALFAREVTGDSVVGVLFRDEVTVHKPLDARCWFAHEPHHQEGFGTFGVFRMFEGSCKLDIFLNSNGHN